MQGLRLIIETNGSLQECFVSLLSYRNLLCAQSGMLTLCEVGPRGNLTAER